MRTQRKKKEGFAQRTQRTQRKKKEGFVRRAWRRDGNVEGMPD